MARETAGRNLIETFTNGNDDYMFKNNALYQEYFLHAYSYAFRNV
jgi:hypothetical protein